MRVKILQMIVVDIFFVYIYLELTEDQIKNQNGARLLSKTFSQQRPYYEKGYVFETDSLTLNERGYLENIHEKVSVEMHSGIIVHFNGGFFWLPTLKAQVSCSDYLYLAIFSRGDNLKMLKIC